MKKLFLFLIVFSASIIPLSSNAGGTTNPNIDVVVTLTIKGEIGKKPDCKGLGLGCLILDLDVELDRRGPAPSGYINATGQMIDNGTFQLIFTPERTDRPGNLFVTDNISLASNISKALGYSSITLKNGTYSVNLLADGRYAVKIAAISK